MIYIKSFTFNPFQENTYVVFNTSKECFIIDPGCYTPSEEVEILDFITKKGLKPVGLLNTHCHIDHVFGNRFIAEKFDLIPQIHQLEEKMLDAAGASAKMFGLDYVPSPKPAILPENQILLGTEVFDILFVPGHSPGHVAFYHAGSKSLISGDVLFRRSIGRTDLPGGDMDTLLASIREKLFALPDETIVYAGHMESTTLGFEKENNPFLNA